jgi:antitoxin YefM
MLKSTTLTASDARSNFYNLISEASKGLRSFEITLRGSNPVVLISKEELESWLETVDILSSPEEMQSIKSAAKKHKLISHADLKKSLGL